MTHQGLRKAVILACFVCPAATLVGLWHGRPVESGESLLWLALLYGFLALPYAPAFRVARRDPCRRWGLIALLVTLLVVGTAAAAAGWLITTPVDTGGCGLGPAMMLIVVGGGGWVCEVVVFAAASRLARNGPRAPPRSRAEAAFRRWA